MNQNSGPGFVSKVRERQDWATAVERSLGAHDVCKRSGARAAHALSRTTAGAGGVRERIDGGASRWHSSHSVPPPGAQATCSAREPRDTPGATGTMSRFLPSLLPWLHSRSYGRNRCLLSSSWGIGSLSRTLR